VLSKMFELKREEVAADWRRLPNEEFITGTLHQFLLRL
jgi:hypothetical protein